MRKQRGKSTIHRLHEKRYIITLLACSEQPSAVGGLTVLRAVAWQCPSVMWLHPTMDTPHGQWQPQLQSLMPGRQQEGNEGNEQHSASTVVGSNRVVLPLHALSPLRAVSFFNQKILWPSKIRGMDFKAGSLSTKACISPDTFKRR